jgi:hypothetical protein
MPLTGEWLRRAQFRSAQFSEPDLVDPAHAQPGQADDPRMTAVTDAPAYYPVAPSEQFVDTEFVMLSQHVPTDRTPNRSTDGGPRSADTPTPAPSHQIDLGADERYQTQVTETFVFTGPRGDRYTRTEEDGLPSPYEGTTGDTQLRRGLNSYDVNNGPSGRALAWETGDSYLGRAWRRGYYHRYWVEHDIAIPPRFHDYRIVSPNVASRVTDIPPPDADGGPYNSPFSSLARAVRNQFSRPMIRREPEPMSESVSYDGTTDGAPPGGAVLPVNDWVVG